MKLSNKISKIFVSLFMIMVVGVLLIIRILYGSFTFRQFQNHVDYSEQLIMNQIREKVDQIEDATINLIVSTNKELKEELQNKQSLDGTDMVTNLRISRLLNEMVLMKGDNFERISLLFQQAGFHINRKDYGFYIDKEPNLNEVIKAFPPDVKGEWYSVENHESSEVEYYYIRKFRSTANLDDIGYVSIQLNKNALRKTYENKENSPYISYFIFDKERNLISGSKETNSNFAVVWQQIERKKFQGNVKYSGKKNYYKYSEIPETSWSFITLMDYDIVENGSNAVTSIVIVLGITAILIMFRVVKRLSDYLAEPVVKLANHMVDSKEELPPEVATSKEYKEVEILTSSFNTMIQNNQKLFYRIQEEEESKRKLEISIVQAQIKPHFLYNTLDTAYCLIDMEEAELAKKTIKLLADYYRGVLNRGLVWTSLESEVKSVSTYMQIQQMRYPNKIDFTTELEESVKAIFIPNLTLQPLVENAIYHGLKPIKECGIIKIRGFLEKSWVYVDVIDSGIGFKKEDFNKYMNDNSQLEFDSFGMKNILDRLKLCYGAKSRLELLNNEPKGTIIRICIYLGSDGYGDV